MAEKHLQAWAKSFPFLPSYHTQESESHCSLRSAHTRRHHLTQLYTQNWNHITWWGCCCLGHKHWQVSLDSKKSATSICAHKPRLCCCEVRRGKRFCASFCCLQRSVKLGCCWYMWTSCLGLTSTFHPCWSFREKTAKYKVMSVFLLIEIMCLRLWHCWTLFEHFWWQSCFKFCWQRLCCQILFHCSVQPMTSFML